MPIGVRPECEVVNRYDAVTSSEQRKRVVRRMNHRCPKSTRERRQADLLPEKSEEHRLNETRRNDEVAVQVRKRFLVAWLTDDDQ